MMCDKYTDMSVLLLCTVPNILYPVFVNKMSDSTFGIFWQLGFYLEFGRFLRSKVNTTLLI